MTFVTADMVASMTGFTDAAAFLHARARLERDHGFPAPMPTCLRPMKWRLDAISAWTETKGQPDSRPPIITGPNVILLEEARKV